MVAALACGALLLAPGARGDEPPLPPTPPRPRHPPQLRGDFEVEYYLPTHAGRQIQSIFSNALFGAQLLRNILVLELGVTWTDDWGYIFQHDGLGIDRRYDSRVFGAGPIFLVRCEPVHLRWFSLSLDLLGGLVVYSAHFPPGGDIYNFTWRLGGALLFRLSRRFTLSAGSRWMHASNGQGIGTQNPSYEGVGVFLGLTYRL